MIAQSVDSIQDAISSLPTDILAFVGVVGFLIIVGGWELFKQFRRSPFEGMTSSSRPSRDVELEAREIDGSVYEGVARPNSESDIADWSGFPDPDTTIEAVYDHHRDAVLDADGSEPDQVIDITEFDCDVEHFFYGKFDDTHLKLTAEQHTRTLPAQRRHAYPEEDTDLSPPDGFEEKTATRRHNGRIMSCPDCSTGHDATCPDCDGDGMKRCPRHCDNGMIECETCGGDGNIQRGCPQCGGDGEIEKPCGVCGGDKYIKLNGEKQDCENCQTAFSRPTGKISTDCLQCNGGLVTRSCNECQGGMQPCPKRCQNGTVACDKCGRTGEVDCATCKTEAEVWRYDRTNVEYTVEEETIYDTTTDSHSIDGERSLLRNGDLDWEGLGTNEHMDQSDDVKPIALGVTGGDKEVTVRTERDGWRLPGRVITVQVPSELQDECEDFPSDGAFEIHSIGETTHYTGSEYPFQKAMYARETPATRVKRYLDQSAVGSAISTLTNIATGVMRLTASSIARTLTYPLRLSAPESVQGRIALVGGGLLLMAVLQGLSFLPEPVWAVASVLFLVFLATLPRIGPVFYTLVMLLWVAAYTGLMDTASANQFATIEAGVTFGVLLILANAYALAAAGTKYVP